MAESKSLSMGGITCDLCYEQTKQFCNSCQVNLCDDCVRKHRGELRPLSHDIVPFLDRELRLVPPPCQEHPGQRCQAHCQQCQTPVCTACVTGPHGGHCTVGLTKIFEEIKQKIKNDTREIEDRIIQYYLEKEVETENTISKVMEEIKEVEHEKDEQRRIWHQEVDSIFDKIDSLYQDLTGMKLSPLRTQQAKIRSIILDLTKRVQQNKDILKSNTFPVDNQRISKSIQYRFPPENGTMKMPSFKVQTIGGDDLSIELGDFKAKLTQHSLTGLSLKANTVPITTRRRMDKVTVIASISVRYSFLHSIACVGTDAAWIRGENKYITRVDILGSSKETVRTLGLYRPSGISVTNLGELVYSDNKMRTVYIVRCGAIERLIKTPDEYYPEEVCCTRSGDILVHMRSTVAIKLIVKRRNKIVRYHDLKMTQEIKNDEHGNLLLKEGLGPLFMTENINGDICISDTNAQVVVAVDKCGNVQFRYEGKSYGKQEAFSPGYIVTDSLGEVILTDRDNDCLHILDQNGQFLMIVNDCGLERPYGLSVDSKGRLWVALPDSREIKVIQYLTAV